MGLKVYKYGALAPIGGAELVDGQMLLALRYQHTLTRIERTRREAYSTARLRIVGDVAHAERAAELAREWLAAGRAALAREHVRMRSKRTSPEWRARIEALKRSARDRGAHAKAARRAAASDPALKAEARLIDERAHRLTIGTRKAFDRLGLFWGTRALVDKACEQAAIASRKAGSLPAFRPRLRAGYVHWDERACDGQIGVQLQSSDRERAERRLTGVPLGLLTADVFGLDSRVRIEPLPAAQWDTRSGRRRARTVLSIRIGSAGSGNRTPIWAKFPIVMHRPLPANGVIKWVTVSRRMQSTRAVWSVEITVDEPDAPGSPNPRVAALHVGWRVLPAGVLRVAYLLDEDGHHEEIALRQDVIGRLDRERGIRSVLGSLREDTQAALIEWLREGHPVPEWLARRTGTLGQWRSPRRLVRLAEEWRFKRFACDESIFPVVWHWRERWRHLSQMADGLTARVAPRRAA